MRAPATVIRAPTSRGDGGTRALLTAGAPSAHAPSILGRCALRGKRAPRGYHGAGARVVHSSSSSDSDTRYVRLCARVAREIETAAVSSVGEILVFPAFSWLVYAGAGMDRDRLRSTLPAGGRALFSGFRHSAFGSDARATGAPRRDARAGCWRWYDDDGDARRERLRDAPRDGVAQAAAPGLLVGDAVVAAGICGVGRFARGPPRRPLRAHVRAPPSVPRG